MKISVITVAYNSAGTIADTLRSIAGQTHPDIEHIIIDGGSTDTTLDQVRQHDRRGAVVVSESDAGIYDAMNKGLALAEGDYVGFLNADDQFASPDSMAHLVAAIDPTDPCDVIYGDLDYVRADHTDIVVRRWRSGEFRRSRLRYGWMPPHPTFYVRRELLRRLGGFDVSLRIAADYDFVLRCLTAPALKVAYVPQVLVRMRVGGVSNRSLASLLRKSGEDLSVMRAHGIGGWFTLLAKNLRKLPQFLQT